LTVRTALRPLTRARHSHSASFLTETLTAVKYHLSEDARCLKTVVVDGKPVLSHVAITPDQTTVVVSDGRALLFYSLPDGTALEQVPDAHHGASITSLSWSPDSALLASSGEDGVVHLWQTPRR